jgi:hypothetical protein
LFVAGYVDTAVGKLDFACLERDGLIEITYHRPQPPRGCCTKDAVGIDLGMTVVLTPFGEEVLPHVVRKWEKHEDAKA